MADPPTLDLDFMSGTLDPRITFTRASVATYFDVNGVMQTVAYNLLFPSINWMANATVSSSVEGITQNAAVAPDSTMTAMRFTPSGSNVIHQTIVSFAGSVSTKYTYSCYVKADGYNYVVMELDNSGFAANSKYVMFDLTNGTILSGASDGTIQSAGNGWYRVSVTATSAGSTGNYQPALRVYDTSAHALALGIYAGNMTSGMLLWGNQVVIGPNTIAYFPTTTAATGAPRFDYDPVTHELNGMLIEKSRTNLLLNSATLSTQSVAVTAQAYTLSFYGTGTVTKSGTATGALVGTGATQRVSQTFTPTAGTLTCTVTGTVSNAQIEAGVFGTSYIPTTSTSMTRAAEDVIVPISSWFSATNSTLYAEYIYPRAVDNQSAHNPVGIGDNAGGSNNKFVLRALGLNFNSRSFFAKSVGTAYNGTLAGTPTNTVTRLAAAWDATSGTGAVNGGAVVTVASALPVSLVHLVVGNQDLNAGEYLDGYIRRVKYWPRTLSPAELQAETILVAQPRVIVMA